MKKLYFLIFVIFLVACHKQQKPTQGYDVVIAKAKPMAQQLFFSGTVQPISTYNVISPIDGVIEKKYFEYGQQLKKDVALFKIRSDQVEKEYRDSLASFLKSKESYSNSKNKLEEDQSLYKAGILASNELHSSETTVNDNYLAYLQSEQALKQVLDKVNKKIDDTKQLKLGDNEALHSALLTKFGGIDLTSSAQGIALLPEKGAGSGESDNSDSNKFIVGSPVKSGQVVVSIGDMSGIGLNISVNQVDINAIRPGQKATISSDAFPGVMLSGEVVNVSAQAASAPGGLPTFPVRIAVKDIEASAREHIAVGMSATVRITIEHEPRVMLPISAVMVQGSMTKVKKQDPATGKIEETLVQTGQTSSNEVAILSGIQAGDHVLVSH